MEKLIKKIKEKKELSGIDDSIVRETLSNYLKKSRINLQSLSESEKKIIIKEIRAELRNLAGRFKVSLKKREFLLDKNNIEELLKTHASTRERLDFYPELINLIDNLKIKSILDLGAGINPIAIAKPGMNYYAFEINIDDLKLVRRFFIKNGIQGEIIMHDIRKPFAYPKADICLILKMFDVLEQRGHKLAEQIIKSLNCKYLLISFSTKTLAGNPMRHPQRGWIEWLLKRLGYEFSTLKSKNEIFYLAKKLSQ